jgi:ethanolamine utilization protein
MKFKTMNDPSKKEITTIVRQVLKETGRAAKSSAKPSVPQGGPTRNGPAVLNIFHAGVRKLDEALKQIQQIEETVRRSSVYTVESARSWVCGADVKEGAGVKCILDTVKPDGLEKALQKADILVLPTFCLRTAAKIANLICDDQESNLVFTALLQGKKVLAANDGFMLCDILVNEPLRQEIAQILNKLEGFGMIFCQTDQLHATFQNMISGNTKTESTAPSSTAVSENENAPVIKLITAKVVHSAVDNKKSSIRLAAGGMITPLARDLAKEYSIQIIKTNE